MDIDADKVSKVNEGLPLLAYAAKQMGLEAPLAEASDRVNEQTKLNLLQKVQHLLAKGDTIALLGLSYKPDTHIVEESAGLYLAQQLKQPRRAGRYQGGGDLLPSAAGPLSVISSGQQNGSAMVTLTAAPCAH